MITALLLLALTGIAPQSPVASIKPRTAPMRGYDLEWRPGGKLHAVNVTLKQLIAEAYQVADFQIEGRQPALADVHYDLDAELGPAASANERRQALQTLLADRFQLKLHPSTKTADVLSLERQPSGDKLTPTARPDCAAPVSSSPRACGGLDVRNRSELTGDNVTIADLAAMLTLLQGTLVTDATGLNGHFDIHLKWTPDQHRLVNAEGFNAPPPNGADDDAGTSLPTAISSQLGLKLVHQKSPIPILVVDHAAQAEAN